MRSADRLDVGALSAPFMAGLMDPARGTIPAGDVAVVIAHPDDETIGCGGTLGRMEGATIVLVTDGAPRHLPDAQRYGFASIADYAARRREEMRAALAIAGIGEDALLPLDIADQEVALDMAGLARRLADIFLERGIRVVLTHVYEGGHPDHDATAFAVHAAARLIGERQPVLIIEMPYYRLGEEAPCVQQFAPGDARIQITVPLDGEERERKRRMIAAHGSQRSVLSGFQLTSEQFRPARPYDFSELPNDGRLLYETFDWGFDGARWRSLACEALGRLGLEARA